MSVQPTQREFSNKLLIASVVVGSIAHVAVKSLEKDQTKLRKILNTIAYTAHTVSTLILISKKLTVLNPHQAHKGPEEAAMNKKLDDLADIEEGIAKMMDGSPEHPSSSGAELANIEEEIIAAVEEITAGSPPKTDQKVTAIANETLKIEEKK